MQRQLYAYPRLVASKAVPTRARVRIRVFRIAAVIGFLAAMVYAFFTMASITGSGPDIFPGVFHPVEFTLVIVVALSALPIAYLSCCSIVLRNGFSLGSAAKFVALACAAALIWTFQGYVSDFIVGEGYAGTTLHKALDLTFLVPHQVITIVRGPYYTSLFSDFLPEFAVAFCVLLLLGSIFALSKNRERFGVRALTAIILFYLGILACDLGKVWAPGDNLADDWIWIVAAGVIGLVVAATVECLTNKSAYSGLRFGKTKLLGKIVGKSWRVGVWGAVGVSCWLLMNGPYAWRDFNPWLDPPPVALLLFFVAAVTCLVTAYVTLRLAGHGLPTAPDPPVQPLVRRRRVVV